MLTEDEVLEYLYKHARNGEPISLNNWIKERVTQTIMLEQGDGMKMSVVWIKYILLGLDKDGQIHFLNKFAATVPHPDWNFENQTIERQIEMIDKVDFRVQLTDKGKSTVRQEKNYQISYWANRTAIINAIFTGAIAIILLGLQIKSCRRDDIKDSQSKSEKVEQDSLKTTDKQQQEKTYTELGNKIRAIEDSLKMPH